VFCTFFEPRVLALPRLPMFFSKFDKDQESPKNKRQKSVIQ